MEPGVTSWTCNFGVQGSIPGLGAKHFSVLSVLSSAIFPCKILLGNGFEGL